MFHLIHSVSTCIWPLPKLIQCACQRFLCCVIPPASRNALHPLWPVQPVVRGRRVLRDTSWYGKGNLGILRLKQLRMGYVFSDRQRRRWVQIVLNFQGPTMWQLEVLGTELKTIHAFFRCPEVAIWRFPEMVGFPNKPMGFATKNDQPLGCLDWGKLPPFKETPILVDQIAGDQMTHFSGCQIYHLFGLDGSGPMNSSLGFCLGDLERSPGTQIKPPTSWFGMAYGRLKVMVNKGNF